jgi:hypothetical protein
VGGLTACTYPVPLTDMKAPLLSLSVLAAAVAAHSQGTFRNMDFETARFLIPPTPPGQYGNSVDPAMAFYGWTAGSAPGSNGPPTYFLYNNATLGAPSINLIGPDFPNGMRFNALQGSYSVLMAYFGTGSGVGPSLSQTGVIPTDARSISFIVDPGYNNVLVTLNGVNIPLVPSNGGSLLSGDVSAFAGQSVQLTFTTQHFLYFDNIQFSPISVPEPCTLGLAAFGALSALRKQNKPKMA